MAKLSKEFQSGFEDAKAIITASIEISRHSEDKTKDGWYVRDQLYGDILKSLRDIHTPRHSR